MISPAAVFARDAARQKVATFGPDMHKRQELASAVAGAASAVASFGLLQASLFWLSRSEQDTVSKWLHQVVADWLGHEANPRRQEITTILPDFLVEQDTPVYRLLSNDALELLSYLKRFTKLAANRVEWGA
ncbi:MAG: type III-B CRISPR module-associated protein Cmr5 [Egibacteraceae bacterium]